MSIETSFHESVPRADASNPSASFAKARFELQDSIIPVGSVLTEADADHQLWQAGRYDDLRRKLSEDLIDAEASGNSQQLQAVSNNLACVYRALGDSVSASQLQRQASTRDRDLSVNNQLSTTSLSNLACDALLAGDWAIAEGLLWKSLLAELAAGNAAAAGSDWANLGLIAGLQGDLEACRWRLWQGLKRHRRGGDLLGVAMDLWHLGQAFEAIGNWTLCRKLFDRAEQGFAQIKHDALRAEARLQKDRAAARERVTTFDAGRN